MARPDPPSPALVAVGVGALLFIFIAGLVFADGPSPGKLVVLGVLLAAVGLGASGCATRTVDRRRYGPSTVDSLTTVRHR